MATQMDFEVASAPDQLPEKLPVTRVLQVVENDQLAPVSPPNRL